MAFRDYEGLNETQKALLRKRRDAAAKAMMKAYRGAIEDHRRQLVAAGKAADKKQYVPYMIKTSYKIDTPSLLVGGTLGTRKARFLGLIPVPVLKSSAEVPGALRTFKKQLSTEMQNDIHEFVKPITRRNAVWESFKQLKNK